MYRNKKDVDKHVENLLSKLPAKEFKSRAYSVARLYFEVGDYSNCQKYVEQYLTQKDNNAAAYKLLGQALQKMGLKEKALEQYKVSLDIDPAQTSTILDICELLADDEVIIEPGRAKYWCEKAEATFPRHPVTFRLRERLIAVSNPDPEALVHLLRSELSIRPKDAVLHARLLKHYLNNNKVKEAFEHACHVEFGGKTFINNYGWYEILNDLLKHNSHNTSDWLYQLLLLTVKERICLLSLTEILSGYSKSLIESNELLHAYDQAIESIAKVGASPGFGEFHSALLQHHRGQVALHAATFLLKKAKKDQMSWRDATKLAAPLMLVAWQTLPLDSNVNWLRNAPEKQTIAINRWYSEGTYRCSQAGHYLISNIQEKNQSFLDQVSQCCSGTNWRDKLYKKIFSSKGHLDKIKSSYFASNAFTAPVLRLPRKVEVESYDGDAQREYGSSFHHFVWTLLNYKNYANFKCTLFHMLTYNATTCGPETLNRSDIHAFLYCATLTANQKISKKDSYMTNDRPPTLPANITELLCSLTQVKWWDCAYKFSQNELGTELTDIRATLSRGIEVVRCIDNHGLDPELLCTLGRIFSEKAKMSTNVDEKAQLEIRAGLYYSSAVPLLEKLRSKIVVKFLDKRMFDYTHKDLGTKELNALLEECKLYVAVNHFSEGEYDKVIEILSNLKSPQALYHLGQTYNKIASEENNLSRDPDTRSKFAALLSKAKMFAYKALDRLRDSESNKNHPLYSDTQELIEDIETQMNKIDPDFTAVTNDREGRYSSDENVSADSEPPIRGNHIFRNISSTPKAVHNANVTNYRTAMDSQILENSRVDQQFLGRIENEIKNLQKRDTTIGDFMEQTRNWFDENRKLGNQIISTIQSNMQNTTDQFKLLKISVDQVKDQIDECRNECKDVSELKKQVAELKKEVGKLKKASSEQTIDDSDLYNLDEEYRTNDSSSSFAAQLPFAPSQVIPSFNQRIVPPFPVPPNPYQLYNQSLYNLYNQYSQFAQPSSVPVPGTQPMFDPTRAQVNYPGVYQTPDQMYLDVAHLVPPNMSSAPTVQSVPVAPTLSSVPTMPGVSSVAVPPPVTSITMSKTTSSTEPKDAARSLPVNVVITSSDPLPTCTTTPAPILSVTIPPKHIKGTPHNYQIQLPPTTDSKVSPPLFVFPAQNNKTVTTNPVTNWNQSSVFKTTPVSSTSTFSSLLNPTIAPKLGNDSFDASKSVVDGPFFGGYSPNTSLNKSRTLSDRSNTSVDNYDPCPDFKPIVPLPAEVKVTTGEEDEYVIFSARAKLFRFVDKQWKERGLGEMKLLKHKTTGKVRVLMRREQVHKICANHIITADMEIKQMKNETKAYFWVANDYADETVVLEKFSIRFKTADIAQDFYNAFEKARQESMLNKNLSPVAPKSEDSKVAAPKIFSSQLATANKDNTAQSTPGKAVVGGFTFSSTPTFKPVSDDVKPDTNSQEVASSKPNVFSGLSFKTTTSSPFTNLFGNASTTNTKNTINDSQASESTKLNTSDHVEEYEPNVEFKPVVPLPALVDQKTGEEDETILFEHRAKLLRFDAAAKEWKERGLGNIKLLVHKDNIQKVRLLMRREQIMKVCCNHAVTNEMVFQKMPNLDKAVTWCAKDFSEGELVAETFCLRFKNIQLCNEFIEAVKSAQSKIKDESKAAKEEKNAAKQNNQTGFGEMFKPKAGSWHCDACYTNNLESFAKCACCDTPKPNSSTTSAVPTAVTNTITEPKPVVATIGWGDKFRPKPGSWECKDCLVRNDPSLENCSACNSPKDPTKAKTSIKLTSDNAPKFNFGIPPKTTSNEEKSTSVFQVTTQGQSVGTGADLFKPSAPTSEVINKTSIFGTGSLGPQFRFGIPPAANDQKPNAGTSSIFDGTGAHKFSFGVPLNNLETSASSVAFGAQKPPANNSVLDALKTPTESQAVDFSFKKNEELSTPVKPALLPTPQTDSSSNVSFGFKESSTFDFVFKPKTPNKGKSPAKSPRSPGDGDDSDGNECAAEDECYHPFTPVIPLPDKVEVVTGEENETELYGQLAKLYRFASGEWKERGKGIVKILKHKETGKLRVVMRREQVLKICLNHALTPEIIYNVKDEKSWQFIVNDFSEGELNLEHFCLRFKSKEVASEFKDAIDNSLQGKPVIKKEQIDKKEKDESDDVVFVSEIQATTEEKQKAKELMLPENFFTYKSKEPCQGCRGCHDSDESSACGTDPQTSSSDKNVTLSSESHATNVEPKPMTIAATIKASLASASTPVKTTTPLFQSPTNSIYGTPSNFEKTVDTSIFRTPLGSLASNAKTPTSTSSQSSFGSNTTNKENTFIKKPSIFSGFGEQTVLFGTPQNKAASIFGSGDSHGASGAKNSLLAPPKLSILNTANENQLESNSNFGTAPTKFVFSETKQTTPTPTANSTTDKGMSFNRSVLEFPAANTKPDSQNSVVKSVFGDDKKSENLFTSVNQGSIFGPGALANSQPKIDTGIFGPAGMSAFGSLSSQNSLFGNGKSIFGTSDHAPALSTAANTEQKKEEPVAVNAGGDYKPKETDADQEPEKKEAPFSVDNSLSFAALSSGGPGFGIKSIQKQPDFKWEGAGQQLFVAKPGNHSGDKSKNESGDGEDTTGADEEYDPHYEPIVPLPDKIVVTTGEEDEEKIYGERCKLYRYDEKSREWKERGVGEMKVLFHGERKTYRLLLRREQVHKAVLNMLLYMDLQLLPMKNSDRAWTWAGRNFAENSAGEQETLAVRFKTVDQATTFHDKIVECVRKLQAFAAQAIKEEKEAGPAVENTVSKLRLPKHLQESARADNAITAETFQRTSVIASGQEAAGNTGDDTGSSVNEMFKQVHFQESEEDHEHDDEEEDYDYDGYYNEDEEESAAYYTCDGEAIVRQGNNETTCSNAHIQVLFDQEIYSPKILVTDAATGEILADMLIYTDTEFQMSGDSCIWSGTDYTSNDPVDKTVTVNFYDNETAMQFYDSCETSKAATYASTDPES